MREASTAADLARDLGPLAPLLLSSSAARQASEVLGYPIGLRHALASLPTRGLAVALCVWLPDGALGEALEPRGPLRAAFPLPLSWRTGPDSPAVPRPFQRAAERIRGLLAVEESIGLGLPLFPEVDLGSSSIAADSAEVALAASLEAARAGRAALWDVWITACYDPREGARGVDHLPEKLRLAREAGIRMVMVAPGDEARARLEVQAERSGASSIEVRSLPPETELHALVRPWLTLARVPPRGTDPLDERLDHHAALEALDPRAASTFYEQALLQDLLERTARGWDGPREVGRLVSFVSRSPWVSLFAARALRPAEVVLLVPPGLEGEAEDVRRRIASDAEREPARTRTIRLPGEDWGEEIAGACDSLDEGGDTWADVTPGPKDVSIRLHDVASRRRWGVVYLEQRQRASGRRAGNERLVLLRRPKE